MKSSRFAQARVWLILTAATLPASSTGAAQTAIDSIRQLDTSWARAYAVHDTAFAQSLLARDIVITNSAGALKTRDQELADFRRSPDLVMNYFRTEDVGIHQYGNQAVVVGNAQWEFTMGGQNRLLRRRYTARYTRGGPLGWQMVELHLFGPAAPPPARSP